LGHVLLPPKKKQKQLNKLITVDTHYLPVGDHLVPIVGLIHIKTEEEII